MYVDAKRCYITAGIWTDIMAHSFLRTGFYEFTQGFGMSWRAIF